MIAELYWIHLENHTDMFSEGYIGVTTLGTQESFLHHKRQATKKSSKTTITSAIRKYGEQLIVECICLGEESYIYDLENKLRPSKGIGWNLAVGGDKPFRSEKGTKPSQKTIDANKARFTPEYREFLSKRNKENGIGFQHGHVREASEVIKQKLTLANKGAWNHPTAAKNPAWRLAAKMRIMFDSDMKPAEIYNELGLTWNNVKNIISLFKGGWLPLEDKVWIRDFGDQSTGNSENT